ncbi:MAG: ABC transporter permease, partial [Candidatus Nanohaloarchaea archaeon]
NLFRRGKRSWLTILGIVIGITAIVALFSLAQGLETSVTDEFESLGANTIYVLPGSGINGFFGGSPKGGLTDNDLEAIKNTRGIDVAGPIIFSQRQGEFRGENEVTPLLGIPTDESQEMILKTNSLVLDKGRNIRDNDRFSALAGNSLVQGEIFDNEVRLRSQLKVGGKELRVVGTLEASGDPQYDRSLVLPIESVRDILGEPERIDFIQVQVESGQEPEKVSERIEKNLRNERNLQPGEEDFTVSTADDLLDSFLGILNLVQYVVLGIVSIALFVGGLGIMNTMYMSVSERTKEIGIMKALGATKKQILTIYITEAAALGLIGGTIGIILGLGLVEIAFYFIRQTVQIPLSPSRSPLLIAGSMTASVVLGVLSGLLPARKAANLEPVEAIRQE